VNTKPINIEYKLVSVSGPDVNDFITTTPSTLTIPANKRSTVLKLAIDQETRDEITSTELDDITFKVVITSIDRNDLTIGDEYDNAVEMTYPLGKFYHAQTSAPDIGAGPDLFEERTIVLIKTEQNTFITPDLLGPDWVSALAGDPSLYGQYPYPATVKVNQVNNKVTVEYTGDLMFQDDDGNTFPMSSGGEGTYNPDADTYDLTIHEALFLDSFDMKVMLFPVQ